MREFLQLCTQLKPLRPYRRNNSRNPLYVWKQYKCQNGARLAEWEQPMRCRYVFGRDQSPAEDIQTQTAHHRSKMMGNHGHTVEFGKHINTTKKASFRPEQPDDTPIPKYSEPPQRNTLAPRSTLDSNLVKLSSRRVFQRALGATLCLRNDQSTSNKRKIICTHEGGTACACPRGSCPRRI